MTSAALPLINCCPPLAVAALGDEQAEDLERVFKALADRHRLKIVNLLAQAQETVCVCDFVEPLGLKQPTVSYHLQKLVAVGLIEREQRGTFAHYRLAADALTRVSGLLTT